MSTLEPAGRWSRARAQAWWDGQPWICGCNFLPSTAVNFLEMWHPASFDAPTIGRELGWAAAIGFNAVRTNPPFTVWQHDRDGLLDGIEHFLAIAHGHGLGTVLCLFDDCEFSGAAPVWGPQPAPVPGVHNSRAIGSPGRRAVLDRGQWRAFEAYVRDVVERFGTDPRILFWDLYNEPGNRMIFGRDGFRLFDAALEAASVELMTLTFGWAREVGPVQPLTVAAWFVPHETEPDQTAYATAADRTALALSDITTFHAYVPRARAAELIGQLRPLGRPMLNTEWMARTVDSRIDDQLELYRQEKVGAFQWGLVRGRSQTHYNWPQLALDPVNLNDGSAAWFHDLLWPDGTPYRPAEVRLIERLTGQAATTTNPSQRN